MSHAITVPCQTWLEQRVLGSLKRRFAMRSTHQGSCQTARAILFVCLFVLKPLHAVWVRAVVKVVALSVNIFFIATLLANGMRLAQSGMSQSLPKASCRSSAAKHISISSGICQGQCDTFRSTSRRCSGRTASGALLCLDTPTCDVRSDLCRQVHPSPACSSWASRHRA